MTDVLATYQDDLGRHCRLVADGNEWVRQEKRHGRWVTMERHPAEGLEVTA
jgi:hypothetical protein